MLFSTSTFPVILLSCLQPASSAAVPDIKFVVVVGRNEGLNTAKTAADKLKKREWNY
jgi:hypothetical protein